MITELKISNTNIYYISGSKGALLFDTGWAGTFPMLCKAFGEKGLRLQDISYILISHYHPDHMGTAQEAADAAGAAVAAADVQLPFLHSADRIFAKEKNSGFVPVDDDRVRAVSLSESRAFLSELGIEGEILHTPGHSDDSISLWLDREKVLFVGDLNPLYELDMHKGSVIEESWKRLLSLKPKRICYGHAKACELQKGIFKRNTLPETDTYALVKKIMKLTDRGCPIDEICDRTGADRVFVEDVIRMYVTHQNVSVQGILDRIEIKGK